MEKTFVLRGPQETDWPEIARLANVAVSHLSAPSQEEWVWNRRRFAGLQRHWLAVRAGAVEGYGGIERGPDDEEGSFRLFCVQDWSGSLEAGEQLHARATAELRSLEASTVWMREYASDEPLIAFFRHKGFRAGAPYRVAGAPMVNLTLALPA